MSESCTWVSWRLSSSGGEPFPCTGHDGDAHHFGGPGEPHALPFAVANAARTAARPSGLSGAGVDAREMLAEPGLGRKTDGPHR